MRKGLENAYSYEDAPCFRELDRVLRDAVFSGALFGYISDLETTVPFHSENASLDLRGTSVGYTKFSTWEVIHCSKDREQSVL